MLPLASGQDRPWACLCRVVHPAGSAHGPGFGAQKQRQGQVLTGRVGHSSEGSRALRDCVGVCSSWYSCSSHLRAEFPLWTEASRATPCLCPCCPPCGDRTQGTSLRATAAPCPGAGFLGSLLCSFCLGAGLSSLGALALAGPSPSALLCLSLPCLAQAPLVPLSWQLWAAALPFALLPQRWLCKWLWKQHKLQQEEIIVRLWWEKILSRVASEPGRWQVRPEESCAAG